MNTARILPISLADVKGPAPFGAALLALNNEFARELSWLDAAKLSLLVEQSFLACRIGGIEAFMLVYDQNSAYEGENFLWFKARFQRFLYVDRIAVAASAQGRGYAKQLYQHLFEQAEQAGQHLIACEVNAEPPNPQSAAFHAGLGFKEIGGARLPSCEKTVRYLLRDLTVSAV